MVLNRQTFLVRLFRRSLKSRRTQLPLSLLVISIDEWDAIKDSRDEQDLEVALKAIAKVFEKNSRTNDIIGRIGENDFACYYPILPQRVQI